MKASSDKQENSGDCSVTSCSRVGRGIDGVELETKSGWLNQCQLQALMILALLCGLHPSFLPQPGGHQRDDIPCASQAVPAIPPAHDTSKGRRRVMLLF